MKRTPLKRRTPLRRTGQPATQSTLHRTRLAPTNRKRRAKLFEKNFGERASRVRAMPCLLSGTGCKGPVQAAHVRSRGAGGDRRDLVPLCAEHHREQHRGAKTFATRYRIDLHSAAAHIAAALDEQGVP